MRAIDLYAGVGGWSLGLRLAGIEVVASYEWWQPAVDTHNANLGGTLQTTDVRKLELNDLPGDIDLVVGSPPCTEFSYSNRGGGGNVDEGLKDLLKFLEVVNHVRPKFWALENVPRVAQVLSHGFADPKHPLYRFRHLSAHVEVIDFSDFGVPQSRRRCIAGNIPFELLHAYRTRLARATLGDVVVALGSSGANVVDPIWKCVLPAEAVTEGAQEPPLNPEELRMNRESKTYHPVYNNMAFPDVLEQPARTVTATCTRVSRESIVISDARRQGTFRRLSVRERASLQGFPITYQFFGRSFPEKVKMVGNAIPPAFTYLLGQAVLGTSAKELRLFSDAGMSLTLPTTLPEVTPPTNEGQTYSSKRSFRAALPGLRFKSGMRFELANSTFAAPAWQVSFFYGPSHDIQEVVLDQRLLSRLQGSTIVQRAQLACGTAFAAANAKLNQTGPTELQITWSHRANGMTPYDVTDVLGDLSAELQGQFVGGSKDVQHAIVGYVLKAAADGEHEDTIRGAKKLSENAPAVLSGLIVGAWFNNLQWHSRKSEAA